MAVATQELFAHERETIIDAGAAAPARTLVKLSGNDRFAVTLTNTSDITGNAFSKTFGRLTVSIAKAGGVGNDKATAIDATQAVGAALDGTWIFEDVASAADGTGTSSATAAQDAPVYYHAGTGKLTTASVANNLVGYVNYNASFVKAAGKLPVRLIGA